MAGHSIPRDLAEQTIAQWRDAGYVAASAARRANVPCNTFKSRLERAQQMLGVSKPVLAEAAVPPDHVMTKTTVQYDANGKVIQEWRRLAPEAEALETIAARLCEQVAGKAPSLPKPPARVAADLLLEVPIFDPHFGKYAWAAETGTDYDLETAHRIVVGSVVRLAELAGPVGRSLLVIGGDWFHADTRHNQTERGHHPLDVDTRQAKVWETVADAIHTSVRAMAATSQQVELVVIPGNHDWESSYHLARLLAAYYRNEKRVHVCTDPRSRQYVRHGAVLLGFAHGHLIPMGDYASLMPLEAASDWAQTTERVWHLGHIHKGKALRAQSLDGKHGVTVEHIESLSGTDAWHHENGFVGCPRRGTAFVWHAKYGLRSRLYVGADEFPAKVAS